MGRYLTDYEHLTGVHLHPGELLMSSEPLRVTTILGSCVAACMFDPVGRNGAICHAALPNAPTVLHKDPFRYADEAILYLMERYRRMGVPTSRLVIKLFGGADVLGCKPRDGYVSIGRQNTMAAVETLGWEGVRPTVNETGGESGRKVVFISHTGDVFVKRLGKTASRTIETHGGS